MGQTGMETEVVKLLGNWGGPGLLAAVLWLVAKRYMDGHQAQVQVTQQALTSRIEALEKSDAECQRERAELSRQLVDVLRKSPRNTAGRGRTEKERGGK
jgi:hypothetical protein